MTETQGGSDVVVVGGGIVGLSVALYLARENVSVTVLDQALVGAQASWASAGMLAPLAEAKTPGPFMELCLAGLRAYPQFVDSLREDTGLDAELFGPGLLRIAVDETEVEELCGDLAAQKACGMGVEWLDGAAVRKLEPEASASICAAILSPQEKHVDPRLLSRAAALAAAKQGVRLVENTCVVGFERQGGRVTAVRTLTGQVPCGQVIIAGGAWSQEIGKTLGVNLPVFPVRGQILALTCVPSPIRHTLYGHAGYLTPKADGRVLVGASQEHTGFDIRPTSGGMGRLLNAAHALVPVLADYPFESAWAGLRPGTPDAHPLLGRLKGWDNVHAATGHFRNGVLLAAVTAEMIAGGILGKAPHPLLSAFSPDRFAQD